MRVMTAKRMPLLTVALGTLLLPACYFDASTDGYDDKKDEDGHGETYNYWPPDLSSNASVCESSDPKSICYRQDDYTWRTSCKSNECQSVEVFVHYMLSQNLGENRVIHVEAFDNAHFQGAPTSTVSLTGFNAIQGKWEKTELFLEPGEYYLRAYLTDENSTIVPYELGGMTLVADSPVGVHGALSSAQAIRVAPRSQELNADPVHIYLNKLLSKPGSEVDTKARLRFNITMDNTAQIPDGRSVLIYLFDTPDMSYDPKLVLGFGSEQLLIQGRVGRADFLSPSLPVGQYFLYAFLDRNGNSMHDEGEEEALYQGNGEPKIARVEANRTLVVPMALQLTNGEDTPAAAVSGEVAH